MLVYKSSFLGERRGTRALVLGALLMTTSLAFLTGCGEKPNAIPAEPPQSAGGAPAPAPASEQQAKDQQIMKQATDEKGSVGPGDSGAPPPPPTDK